MISPVIITSTPSLSHVALHTALLLSPVPVYVPSPLKIYKGARSVLIIYLNYLGYCLSYYFTSKHPKRVITQIKIVFEIYIYIDMALQRDSNICTHLYI